MTEELLLHVCCGPCACGSVPDWLEYARGAPVQGGWSSAPGVSCVTAFFFNPNIHPLLEFRRRLTGARDAMNFLGLELLEDLTYDPAAWFAQVVPGEGSRCRRCIAQRLDRTAAVAAERGSAAFSTTLSLSPWQDHEAIKVGGTAAAARHGVEFLYEDQRAHYRASQALSREWGLYRQKYCGCLLSEWERYRKG